MESLHHCWILTYFTLSSAGLFFQDTANVWTSDRSAEGDLTNIIMQSILVLLYVGHFFFQILNQKLVEIDNEFIYISIDSYALQLLIICRGKFFPAKSYWKGSVNPHSPRKAFFLTEKILVFKLSLVGFQLPRTRQTWVVSSLWQVDSFSTVKESCEHVAISKTSQPNPLRRYTRYLMVFLL